jgi:hypothetical protein
LIGDQQANCVRDGLVNESLQCGSADVLDHAGDDIALTLYPKPGLDAKVRIWLWAMVLGRPSPRFGKPYRAVQKWSVLIRQFPIKGAA